MRKKIINSSSPLVKRIMQANTLHKELCASGVRPHSSTDDVSGDKCWVTELFNEMFWASTHAEEGRAIRGSICICAPSETRSARQLNASVPVTSRALIQLFVAAPHSALGVHVVHGRLVVWGFIDVVPMGSLRMLITGNATIVVIEEKAAIAIFEQGELFLPEAADKFSFTMHVANALTHHRAFEARLTFAARLQLVVTAMHRQCHGGALVIIPSTQESPIPTDIKFAYQFSALGIDNIQSVISEWETASQNYDPYSQHVNNAAFSQTKWWETINQSYVDQVSKLLRNAGELSNIDGAVVMDEDLRLLGFGAKLAGDLDEVKIIKIDALTKSIDEVHISSLGGTRHQSAARFVSKNLESMVFVSSQDGRLSLFVGVLKEEKVAVIHRLEHFLWDA